MSWENVEKLLNFTSKYSKQSTIDMIANGKKARLMLTARIKGDQINGLPPGRPAKVFHVDSLPGAPDDWVRGAGSYVVPISEDVAFWFDWTMNDTLNTAILPSVKGLNPFTGQKTNKLELQKYKKCPIHDCDFIGNLFCEKCGHKWKPQNYCCSPNTLWADGWMEPDGTVRQFFFSEEVERDVAAACLGGEKNTVPAFGFAFFEPKNRRNPPVPQMQRHAHGYYGYGFPSGGFSGCSGVSGFSGSSGVSKPGTFNPFDTKKLAELMNNSSKTKGLNSSNHSQTQITYTQSQFYPSNTIIVTPEYSLTDSLLETEEVLMRDAAIASASAAPTKSIDYGVRCSQKEPEPEPERHKPAENVKVSVGAGARIAQNLLDDPMSVEDWKTDPAAIIRLYFVFESKFEKILNDGGIRDIEGHKEGFLKGLKVG